MLWTFSNTWHRRVIFVIIKSSTCRLAFFNNWISIQILLHWTFFHTQFCSIISKISIRTGWNSWTIKDTLLGQRITIWTQGTFKYTFFSITITVINWIDRAFRYTNSQKFISKLTNRTSLTTSSSAIYSKISNAASCYTWSGIRVSESICLSRTINDTKFCEVVFVSVISKRAIRYTNVGNIESISIWFRRTFWNAFHCRTISISSIRTLINCYTWSC